MKTISITWKNSQKALRASSTFLKVGTFVGLNLAGMGINAVHAAPHTHGEGKLQILQAGSEWQFVLQLPAADVLGFEYAPSTTSEKKRYEETQKVFQRFDDIFTLSNTCELLDITLESPWEVANEHEGHAHRNTHSDFRVAYLLSCQGPVKRIEMTGFPHWPSLQHVNAIWVANKGQGALEVTPSQPALLISS
ncbi:ZrgA family zinc uptake protein [Alteromonas macleodii]|uniref:ZrgA family zinc uptake protein n=1 Tax=Alteromonas macleodii TaxID=28108 RepID=UPI001E301C95|nr:DUF2796 domain-containing protein [Alteromonas macleodii]MEC7360332.1 DUF2796 domain-containing protein [Pseudomonadota bacterium]